MTKLLCGFCLMPIPNDSQSSTDASVGADFAVVRRTNCPFCGEPLGSEGAKSASLAGITDDPRVTGPVGARFVKPV